MCIKVTPRGRGKGLQKKGRTTRADAGGTREERRRDETNKKKGQTSGTGRLKRTAGKKFQKKIAWKLVCARAKRTTKQKRTVVFFSRRRWAGGEEHRPRVAALAIFGKTTFSQKKKRGQDHASTCESRESSRSLTGRRTIDPLYPKIFFAAGPRARLCRTPPTQGATTSKRERETKKKDPDDASFLCLSWLLSTESAHMPTSRFFRVFFSIVVYMAQGPKRVILLLSIKKRI